MRRTTPVPILLALAIAGPAAAGQGEPAPAALASRLAGAEAEAKAGVWIANLDQDVPLSARVDWYKQGGGGRPIEMGLPSIQPGGVYWIYLPSESRLTNGFYSAIVHGDQPLAAGVRTEWYQSGGVEMYDAPNSATDVMLPLVLGNSHGHTSFVTVQNADASAERLIRLDFTRTVEPAPRLTLTLRVPAGEGRTLDLAADPALAALPAGFVGALRVRSDAPVAVQAFMDVPGSEKAIYSLLGVPTALADQTAYLPLFVSRGGVSRSDTLVTLANPGEVPVAATLTIQGTAGSCQGRTYRLRTGSIAPGSNAMIHRWPALDGAAQGQVPGMPADCIGAATVRADAGGRILASATYLTGDPQMPVVAGAYNAFGPTEAARRVIMPVYRKQHTAMKLTTGYQVMNVGAVEARVRVQVSDGAAGPTAKPMELIVAPGTASTFYPPQVAGLAAGRAGFTLIESDHPVAVVGVEASEFMGHDMSVFRGLPVPADLHPLDEGWAVLPLLLENVYLQSVRPGPEPRVSTPATPPRAPFQTFLMVAK
jgi:hypothetical protein